MHVYRHAAPGGGASPSNSGSIPGQVAASLLHGHSINEPQQLARPALPSEQLLRLHVALERLRETCVAGAWMEQDAGDAGALALELQGHRLGQLVQRRLRCPAPRAPLSYCAALSAAIDSTTDSSADAIR